MITLTILVEGQTEEQFVTRLLRPHLQAFHVFCKPQCIVTGTRRRTGTQFRGGVQRYKQMKTDVRLLLHAAKRRTYRVTTMFDFYGLPSDFPAYDTCHQLKTAIEKVRALEQAFQDNINNPHFIPYLQLHEFEALVLVNPHELEKEYPHRDKEIAQLAASIQGIAPEEINNDPKTAPSKRILQTIPKYSKVSVGSMVAEAIGLATLRSKCPHFHGWLTKLENLAKECTA